MSPSLGKSIPLPPAFRIDDEVRAAEKQGIVFILGSDCERPKNASLRRTLSADMSSRKWLAQNGFSPIKKTASSEELLASIADSSSFSEEDDNHAQKDGEGRGQLDIWNSIQEAKKQDAEKCTWSSILSHKLEDSKSLPPPYFHPLVKRSTSSLSEKSLQICTESLGSETGSDGFSSYPPSEVGDMEDAKAEEHEPLQQEGMPPQSFGLEEFDAIKYNFASTKKIQPRSFPPPLPSLSREDGASLSVHSRRDNGRLVLEAVSISSEKHFQAQREDGRLVLTFVNSVSSGEEIYDGEEVDDEETENMSMELNEDAESFYGNSDEEEEESEEDDREKENPEEAEELEFARISNGRGAREMAFVMEQTPNMSSGVINVHKLALLMNKPICPPNRSSTWQSKFDKVANYDEEEDEALPLKESLPLRAPVARMLSTQSLSPQSAPAAASFNAYEYFWRAKPMTTAGISPITLQFPSQKNCSNNSYIMSKYAKPNEPQEAMLVKGNEAYYLTSCNKPRSTLFLWEPKCIATS
ncbi:protein FAF-like, chloroplastic [Rhodamnia argentea]|uniref:Protein FAF-like, chloroplastic n=1 Tax=Rhodamnia argentea TaxID=178133 RepID=A0A8B8QXI7_9MYRT|nr:protein FAF-like, chloroplastic [Rhodamnia argentea]XP_030551029.1 protein FAF-like, chloroplastic [Rhodamnia argentea]